MKLRLSFRLITALLIMALVVPVPFIVCADSSQIAQPSKVAAFFTEYFEEIALVFAGLAAGLPVNFQRVISPLLALGRKVFKKK